MRLSLLALAASMLCTSSKAMSQASPQGTGIRYVAEIGLLPADDGAGSTASLNVIFRIAAYSPEGNFVGTQAAAFDDIEARRGAPARQVWQDASCHHDRGVPKVWIVGIEGSVERDGHKLTIQARPRQLGRLLPKDELATRQQVAIVREGNAVVRVTRARAQASGVETELRLIGQPCALQASETEHVDKGLK